MQYYNADSKITDQRDLLQRDSGNVISIMVGAAVPSNRAFPLSINENGVVSIRDAMGKTRIYQRDDAAAAIFVRPFAGERLELVVWGADAVGANMAARLIPTLTGVGQPDFVVLGESCRWKGVDGVVAMGFFDHLWNITFSSFFS